MASLQVRIFPHSQKEFPSLDFLHMWLLTALRGRGGVYHLRSADSVKDLATGSVVLFRYGHKIVGEAVVSQEKLIFDEELKDKTLSGEAEEYEAQVTFAPSSIRLYSPPVAIEFVQKLLGDSKNITTYPGAYVELDWNIYAQILAEVASRGAFVS